MTMEQVAAKMGISKGGLSKALNGNPTLKTLRAVAEVLQVPVIEFFADESEVRTTVSSQPPTTCPYCGHELNIKVE